jgi:hypothetical protein
LGNIIRFGVGTGVEGEEDCEDKEDEDDKDDCKEG